MRAKASIVLLLVALILSSTILLTALNSVYGFDSTTRSVSKSDPANSRKLRFAEEEDLMGLKLKGLIRTTPAEPHIIKELTFEVKPEDCSLWKTKEGYDYLKVRGLKPDMRPGEPQLPASSKVVKLPKYAKILAVGVVEGRYRRIIDKLVIMPVPEPLTWMKKDKQIKRPIPPIPPIYRPKREIYQFTDYFPGKIIDYSIGQDNKYTYVSVKFYPVQYIPAKREAILITKAKVNIYYIVKEAGQEETVKEITWSSQVNPSRSSGINVIITPDSLIEPALDLADFHTIMGTVSYVVTTSWIYANYPEAEDPPYDGYKDSSLPAYNNIVGYNYSLAKKIISYLRDVDAHPNLKYVTLLGTARLVPPSYYIYIDHYDDYNNWIPTDFFYSSPDYDLVPNYAVGRLPALTKDEAEWIIHKIIQWSLTTDWNSFKTVTLAGSRPFGTEYFYGELITIDSVNRGYFEGMIIDKLFGSEGRFSSRLLKNAMNYRTGFLYIITHGSGNCLSTDDFSICASELLSYSMPSFNVPIVVSIACMNGAFDTDTYSTDYGLYSFGMAVLSSRSAGIAYIGGVRVNYGTPSHHFENGILVIGREWYMAEMLTYVFESYHEGATKLGDLTKNALFKFWQSNYPTSFCINDVTLFEFVLLGDPALSIPAQHSAIEYSQPSMQAMAPEGHYYDVPWYIPGDKINIMISSDSPTITIKSVDAARTYSIIDEKSIRINGEPYTYSIRLYSSENRYVIKASGADGKETWLYVLGLKPLVGHEILLVEYGWQGKYYVEYYEDALYSNGYAYDIWNKELRGYVSYDVLRLYRAVVWFQEWGGPYYTERASLRDYLDSGGRLFISGQDIGWYLHDVDPDFFQNYLHAKYIRDHTGIYEIQGVSGDPIGDGLAINIQGGDGANNQLLMDEITPADSYATEVFMYSGDGCAAIKADTGTYKVVYFAFGFEAINNRLDRLQVMKRVMQWLFLIEAGSVKADSNWRSVYFPKSFTSTPVIIATIMSENGGDNSHVDLRNPSPHGFEVRVEEDNDADGVHVNPEEIGWIAIEPGVYMFRGKLLIAGMAEVDHSWTHISFPINFSSTPVIVASIMTENDPDNAHIDLRNPSSSGFEIRIEEDLGEDGEHSLETVGWIALESGLYGIQNGIIVNASSGSMTIEAGMVQVDHNWKKAEFLTNFRTAVTIVASIMTENGGDNSHIDVKGFSGKSAFFRVEEDMRCDGTHTIETVGYIAVGVTWADTLTVGTVEVASNWKHVDFSEAFHETPVIVATIITENGGDNSHIDLANPSPEGFDVRVEEDTEADGNHVNPEKVAFLAIPQGVYVIDVFDGYLVAGIAQANDKWTSITFPIKFSKTPVIIARIMTENGPDNSHIDQRNPSQSGFEVRVEEDVGCDGPHKIESIGWIALEPGEYFLLIRPGFYRLSSLVADTASVDSSWTKIIHHIKGSETIVLASIMTENGGDNSHIDLKNVLEVGFEARVEEDMSCDGTHTIETIGYIYLATS